MAGPSKSTRAYRSTRKSLAFLENQIEGLVREKVRRGSVHVTLRLSGGAVAMANRVSESTLKSYLDQVVRSVGVQGYLISIELGSILQLPGVLLPNPGSEPEKLTALALSTLGQALDNLNRMRQIEGQQMGKELTESAAKVRAISDQIEARAPHVLIDYRKRLEARVRSALAEMLPTVGEIDVLREVVQFSDRCDIREEIVRLYSHLEQFHSALGDKESQGRRLDFLIQELARETNTIGAKANDATIAHGVVSIKTTIEQMRELVQNVE
jgi:uncharacterized protein (TIGR00255 family)